MEAGDPRHWERLSRKTAFLRPRKKTVNRPVISKRLASDREWEGGGGGGGGKLLMSVQRGCTPSCRGNPRQGGGASSQSGILLRASGTLVSYPKGKKYLHHWIKDLGKKSPALKISSTRGNEEAKAT